MTLFPKHVKAFEKQRACSAVSKNIQMVLDSFSILYLSSEYACHCLVNAAVLSDQQWEKPPQSGELNFLPPVPEFVMNQRARLLNSLFKRHSIPKPRTATTTVPGRALPLAALTDGELHNPSCPARLPAPGFGLRAGGHSGDSSVPPPGSLSDLGWWHRSTRVGFFTSVKISPGVLRGSSEVMQQTLVMVPSPARHRTATGSVCSAPPDCGCPWCSSFFSHY